MKNSEIVKVNQGIKLKTKLFSQVTSQHGNMGKVLVVNNGVSCP